MCPREVPSVHVEGDGWYHLPHQRPMDYKFYFDGHLVCTKYDIEASTEPYCTFGVAPYWSPDIHTVRVDRVLRGDGSLHGSKQIEFAVPGLEIVHDKDLWSFCGATSTGRQKHATPVQLQTIGQAHAGLRWRVLCPGLNVWFQDHSYDTQVASPVVESFDAAGTSWRIGLLYNDAPTCSAWFPLYYPLESVHASGSDIRLCAQGSHCDRWCPSHAGPQDDDGWGSEILYTLLDNKARILSGVFFHEEWFALGPWITLVSPSLKAGIPDSMLVRVVSFPRATARATSCA
jgi:hypothetical protein